MQPKGAITFLLIVLGVSLIITALVGWQALSFKTPEPTLKITIYPDIVPGVRLPSRAVCRMPIDGEFERRELDCEVWMDNNLQIGFSTFDDIVDYVSYMDLTDTVGDLLAAWGPPVGYDCDRMSYTFHWSDRSAYIVPKFGLSMDSIVGFVQFGTPGRDFHPWPTYGGLPLYCSSY